MGAMWWTVKACQRWASRSITGRFEQALERTRYRMNEDAQPVGIRLESSKEERRISAEIEHPRWCDRRRCSA